MSQNPKGKFAVLIDDRNTRYLAPRAASKWWVLAVGRETPQRVYAKPAKPARRWDSDPYWALANVGARFDTVEEAQAFIDQARAATADLDAEVERFEREEHNARQSAINRRATRDARLRNYLEANKL